MPQKDLELILMRQMASSLATAVFLVDPQGQMVYFNEQAESILGRRFDESGPMPVNLWSTAFQPLDELGNIVPPESLPLVTAIRLKRPGHRRLWIRGLDGVKRRVEVTAFPLIGQNKEVVGAVSLLWEVNA